MAAVTLTNANRAIPIPPEQGEDRSLCIGIHQAREEKENEKNLKKKKIPIPPNQVKVLAYE